MFGIGPTELIIVLVLALIIFGPGKLPEVGKAIGRSIKEFKSASSNVEESVKSVTSAASSSQATSQPAAATAQNNAPEQSAEAQKS